MDKIKQYFIEEKQTSPMVANILAKILTKYHDIQLEFEYWLTNRKYKQKNALIIEGYTAQQISEIESSLDPAGVYNFMVTLRDNPEKGLNYLKNGFPRK